jgi:starch phosphorylase
MLAKTGREATPIYDRPPTEAEIEDFKARVLAKLVLAVGKDGDTATPRDWFVATALALRDQVIHRWLAVNRVSHAERRKHVYYLSLEFLIGRLFADIVENLRMTELVRAALGDLGVDLDRMRRTEPDAALGNGGLGRLAACLMESMASLGVPACGYGIRYDHGLFRQVIRDGWQQEYAEDWLSFGNPWEFARPELVYQIQYSGHIEPVITSSGQVRSVWHPEETIEAVAYDTPVVGWRGRHVNPLRLWSARAIDPLRLEMFNEGDHVGALSEQARAEAISKILYPGDSTVSGRELRLRQEYFFVSASLQDIIRRHFQYYGDLPSLPDYAAIQLNDTHPSIAIAELMRLLVDVYDMPWDAAWKIISGTFSYTNHTLLPEALESWPVELFQRLLPRHLEIIYRINAQHLEAARGRGFADGGLHAISLIDENHGRRVRMGHLAFIGSHRVNGVSALHTKLMAETVFADLHRLYPERIVNKTNGITFRRWLHQANPGLTRLLVAACGREVLDDEAALLRLVEFADDPEMIQRLAAVKRANKIKLSVFVHEQTGLALDPDALFDVHIKRIHEYKRQLLNLLDTVVRYHAIRANPGGDWMPRVKIFAGKAAASYTQAKLIIKLANDIAAVVNNDPATRDLLRLVFLPNYNVSLAEMIIPAADLSEQISTAGMEASGTGNMKLALNGALTIGTLDGANIEILEHVGAENIFIFGLTAEQVEARRRRGLDADDAIAASPELADAIDAIGAGAFSPDDLGRFRHTADGLRYVDPYMIAADFADYRRAQAEVETLRRRPGAWGRAAALNIARIGWFSADRTIAEYAADIWHARPKYGRDGAVR